MIYKLDLRDAMLPSPSGCSFHPFVSNLDLL